MSALERPLRGAFWVLFSPEEGEEAEWLKARCGLVGASDHAKVMGVIHWGSPLSIYQAKVAPQPREETPAQRWGHLMEQILGEEVAAEHGATFIPDQRLCQSIEKPHLGATFDGWLVWPDGQECLLELKTTAFFKEWKDGIPLHYLIQCQAQMFVAGETRMMIAVLDKMASQHYWEWVDFDERLWTDWILPKSEEFWAQVLNREPPDPDGSEATARALKILYPKHVEAKSIQLPAGLWEEHEILDEAKADEKDAKARKTAAENQIKAALGDAERGHFPGTTISYSWKTDRRGARTLRRHERKS